MKNEHFFCRMLLIYLQLRRTHIVLCIFLLLLISYCFCVLYFMHYSYMCALSCSSRPAIVLYCFVGRETLCCLCLNKLLCIVLYINNSIVFLTMFCYFKYICQKMIKELLKTLQILLKSREISRSGFGPFLLACTDPYIRYRERGPIYTSSTFLLNEIFPSVFRLNAPHLE